MLYKPTQTWTCEGEISCKNKKKCLGGRKSNMYGNKPAFAKIRLVDFQTDLNFKSRNVFLFVSYLLLNEGDYALVREL